MKTEGMRQSSNILDLRNNPLLQFWQGLLALAHATPRMEEEAQVERNRWDVARRRQEAELYYKLATGRNPSEEFFNQLFRGEYIPADKLGNIGYFLMSNDPIPDQSGTELSMAVPPGANALMTKEEAKTFLRTGPRRR